MNALIDGPGMTSESIRKENRVGASERDLRVIRTLRAAAVVSSVLAVAVTVVWGLVGDRFFAEKYIQSREIVDTWRVSLLISAVVSLGLALAAIVLAARSLLISRRVGGWNVSASSRPSASRWVLPIGILALIAGELDFVFVLFPMAAANSLVLAGLVLVVCGLVITARAGKGYWILPFAIMAFAFVLLADSFFWISIELWIQRSS